MLRKDFHKIIDLCDLVALYDNTDEFRRFAIYKNGQRIRVSKIIPKWYEKRQEECH